MKYVIIIFSFLLTVDVNADLLGDISRGNTDIPTFSDSYQKGREARRQQEMHEQQMRTMRQRQRQQEEQMRQDQARRDQMRLQDERARHSRSRESATHLYEELINLDDLKKKGIITDSEFEAEKKKLLSGN